MNPMRKLLYFLVLLLVVNCAAWADNFYTNPAAWAAAVNSTTSVNFEGIVPSPDPWVFYGYGPGSSTTVGGVQFSVGSAGYDNLLFLFADGQYGYPVATIGPQSTSGGVTDLLVTLPSSVTAISFGYSGLYPPDTTLTLSDGATANLTVFSYPNPNFGFFGVTAPGGITWFDIQQSAGYGMNVDGISYGTANTTPEPASLPLLGTGVLAAAGVIRRKFRV